MALSSEGVATFKGAVVRAVLGRLSLAIGRLATAAALAFKVFVFEDLALDVAEVVALVEGATGVMIFESVGR